MTTTLDDLTPLIEAVTGADPDRQALGERVLAHVLAGVQTLGMPLAGDDAGPWSQLAARLSAT
jgi:hypothetical protein